MNDVLCFRVMPHKFTGLQDTGITFLFKFKRNSIIVPLYYISSDIYHNYYMTVDSLT